MDPISKTIDVGHSKRRSSLRQNFALKENFDVGPASAHIIATRLLKPTAAYDAKWGQFVVDPPFFTKLVYEGV